jgi:hypothetical protein
LAAKTLSRRIREGETNTEEYSSIPNLSSGNPAPLDNQ